MGTRYNRVPTIYVLSKNMKIVKKKIKLNIVIFTAVKNRCILHVRVFVMDTKFPSCVFTITCLCNIKRFYSCENDSFQFKNLDIVCVFLLKT